MPALERNCTADCRDSYISNNSDWVKVETMISTSPDQIAIAPGLAAAGVERERAPLLPVQAGPFLAELSIRFCRPIIEVARTDWNGINIEVYYLKEQPWNVPKMLNSVKKSFEYYTTNFGPYPQKEARIIEFPRVAAFAEAFPGTMPYSESIGFIASIEKPDDIDMVFYVVAHEMAHQWWAHQEVGANMQGATLLVGNAGPVLGADDHGERIRPRHHAKVHAIRNGQLFALARRRTAEGASAADAWRRRRDTSTIARAAW